MSKKKQPNPQPPSEEAKSLSPEVVDWSGEEISTSQSITYVSVRNLNTGKVSQVDEVQFRNLKAQGLLSNLVLEKKP